MENIQPIFKHIVDTKTGEVIDELYEGDKYRIMRRQQIEFYNEHGEKIRSNTMNYFGQDENFSMLSEFSAKQLADRKVDFNRI